MLLVVSMRRRTLGVRFEPPLGDEYRRSISPPSALKTLRMRPMGYARPSPGGKKMGLRLRTDFIERA